MGDSLVKLYTLVFVLASVACIFFALQTMGMIRARFGTFSLNPQTGTGLFGAFTSGALFATVVSPCNLPFLMTWITPLLMSNMTILEGVVLTLGFSVSMSLPIFALGLLSSHAMDKWMRRHVRGIELASGAFLLIAAAYFAYEAYTMGA